jgi:hypothetical protein
MRMILSTIGLLTVLAGIIPLLTALKIKILPSILTNSYVYMGIIVLIGIIGLIYVGASMMLMPEQKAIFGFLAALTIIGGVLPLLAKFLPKLLFLSSGMIHSIVVIALGVIAIIYGMMQI